VRISELSAATDVPVPTLKYYLREGLLPAGTRTSRTQAIYDDSHVERVRLIRALTEIGGLPLATVDRVLVAIGSPDVSRLDLLATAQGALLPADSPDSSDSAPTRASPQPHRAARWLDERGWPTGPSDPLADELDRALAACDIAQLGLDDERLSSYADAVEQIAHLDLVSVPDEPLPAVRHVILGTVLIDAVLAVLRRLAQRHAAVELADTQGPPAP
jgi:DNA-binding transcriptional MerR regulator